MNMSSNNINGGGVASGLDKFYTLPSCSKKCIEKVYELYDNDNDNDNDNETDKPWDLVVEPSAGNGSFLNQLPDTNKVGIDIAPEGPGIVQQDFLTYTPPANTNILVIGNPPFGRVSSTAIKFFNHAAKWAKIVAFIVPRTFRKTSVQNRLDLSFHLVYDEELPTTPCCFSPPMMAKCCFQIWERRATLRTRVDLPTKHADWEFLAYGPKDEEGQPTPPQGVDLALRAYGGKIGEIQIVQSNLQQLRPKSWHWIKTKIDKTTLINRLRGLDYSHSLNTARQNSMGRGELVNLYTAFVNAEG